MADTGGSKAAAVLVYTALRIAVFAAVWLTIELLTPLSGVWAIVVAILVSGAVSLLLLDRQRGQVGAAAAGFFGRLNERIEASARAEDDDGEPPAPSPAPSPGSGEGEQTAENEAVDKQ